MSAPQPGRGTPTVIIRLVDPRGRVRTGLCIGHIRWAREGILRGRERRLLILKPKGGTSQATREVRHG